MCGIVGAFGAVDGSLLQRMIARLAHRGPDDSGIRVLGTVGLGNARLSLLDMAEGAQPMVSADSRFALTFNGEIYNHQELASYLVHDGARLVGQSDTEVLLEGLARHGDGFLARIEGMYAIAATDGKQLLLARDPFGMKPLFYALSRDGTELWFASEAKALLEVEGLERRLDTTALVEFATFGFVLGGRSFLDGIRQVLPGEALSVSRNPGGGLVLSRSRIEEETPPPDASAGDTVEQLQWLLRDSVRGQLHADHPVGCLLSGGLDSTLLATASPRKTGLRTFAVSDEETSEDVEAAEAVARALGLEHRRLRPPTEGLLDLLPGSVVANEAPLGLTLAFASAPFIRSSVKAVLCGDGADEIFCGYPHYRDVPAAVERFGRNYDAIGERGWAIPEHTVTVRATLERLRYSQRRQEEGFYRFFLEDQLANLHLWIWDRGTMSAGLELRLPFLDRRIRKLGASIAWEERVRGESLKAPIKELARRVLPRELSELVVERTKYAAKDALRRTQLRVRELAGSLMPLDYFERHPYRSLFPMPRQLMYLDMFTLFFLGNAGAVPDGFRLSRLYTDHAADLEAFYREGSLV